MVSATSEGLLLSDGEAPERASVRSIFDEHAKYVWRTLRYLGVPPSDVNDAAQEVFLVVHRKLDSFEERSSLRGWLYGICVRVALAHRRRAHVRHEELASEVPELPIEPPQNRQLEVEELKQLLVRSLGELDEDKRAVFVLHELEQLPMPEVARILGCPVQTAYSRHRSAKASLAKRWSRRHGSRRHG